MFLKIILMSLISLNMGEDMSVKQYTLNNGLKLIVKEVKDITAVYIIAGFKVGMYCYEPRNKVNISHYVEHMLFKGTEKRKVGEIAKEIERMGGYLNGFTADWGTAYLMQVPFDKVEYALEINADAVMHSTFPENEVIKEKEVILHELKGWLDDPYSFLFHRLLELVFEVHNYGIPHESLLISHNNLTREDLVKWYRKYYKPNNMVLVVVGNVNSDDIYRKVKELYKDFKPSKIDWYRCSQEPPQKEVRVKVYKGDINKVYVGIAFRGVKEGHPDVYGLRLIANILGGGHSSRLDMKIVENKKLASNIFAMMYPQLDDGTLLIGFETEEDKVKEAIEEVLREIKNLKENGVTQDELKLSKKMFKVNYILSNERISNQGIKILKGTIMFDDPEFYDKYVKKIEEVSLSEIRKIANEYLISSNLSMVVYYPKNAQKILQEKDLKRIIGEVF